MGYTTISVKGDLLRTRVEGYHILDKGRLRALSAMHQIEAAEPFQTYVEFGISKSDGNFKQRIVALASGYIGGTNPISWTGDIPMQPEMALYLFVWSSAAATIKLGVVTEE